MHIPIVLVAVLLARSQVPVEAEFVNWYSLATTENDVKTILVNNGSTSLPDWLQITKPDTKCAKVVMSSHAERDIPGATRFEKKVTGKLKWHLTSSVHPGTAPVYINFGPEGRADATVLVGTEETTCKAQGRDDNSAVTTKFLYKTTAGGDSDIREGTGIMRRLYTPTWEPISGGWQCYLNLEFKEMYALAVVHIAGEESMLLEEGEAEPEANSIATPRSAAFGKAATQFWTSPRTIPTYEMALNLDDGCIRVYGVSVGYKNDRVIAELFTGNGVPILGRFYLWIGTDGGADDDFFVDTPGIMQPGTYRLYLTPPSALRRKFEFYFDGASPTLMTTSYIWGDVNRDNTITQFDLDIIDRYMGIDQNHVRWTGWFYDDPVYRDYTPQMCDLNHDGAVTSADMGIAFANLGINGDQ